MCKIKKKYEDFDILSIKIGNDKENNKTIIIAIYRHVSTDEISFRRDICEVIDNMRQ